MRRTILYQGFRSLFLLFALLLPAAAQALQGTGTIQGTVTDPTGAGIFGVRVSAIWQLTGRRYETPSDCGGVYQISNLQPGIYSLRFESEGFRSETRGSILVGPSQITQLDIRLQVGAFGGEPVIVDSGPLLEGPEPKTQPTGEIMGTVREPDGAPVPARIFLTDAKGGKLYSATTDSNGVYRLSHVPAGNYWLRFEVAEREPVAPQAVIVSPSHITCSDIRLVAPKKELVEVCSASCLIETETSVRPFHPGLQLHVYAESNVASMGSELWLTVVLTNTTGHPVFLYAGKSPNPTFGYQIYAYGRCGCPGQLHGHDPGIDFATGRPFAASGSGGPIVRVPPGGTVTDKVDLSKLMSFGHPGTFTIEAERPDTSSAMNCCEEPANQPTVRSNLIRVAVMAPIKP